MADDIDQMEAGRELDALVARDVLGWSDDDFVTVVADGSGAQFSKSMAWAWALMGHLRKHEWYLGVHALASGWWVNGRRIDPKTGKPVLPGFVSQCAATAPLAICRASLRCVRAVPTGKGMT
jgi:hypothetical protein